ncbi:TraB/GumN family protein [Novosphingobium sp. Leaf2]|uniref:TraB/GumN family protein n=1 Tax=Novosphingobium sp. Leaf2 TaxID=1735670 RepID=UPI0006FB1818|nr:TraB/GumN family protein [Novosphingobium sp. Leaf2]KQM17556.1 hypothetical protein ASE49_10585 [Novosphingobium sp. Leaf2]
MRRALILLPLLPLLALLACAREPLEANPALWRVEDGRGHVGWLFGTIHVSERPLAWRTPKVDAALNRAGVVMVEVGNLADEQQVAATFAALAHSQGLRPLSQRVPTGYSAALQALLKKAGKTEADFADTETWAAALTLAQAGADAGGARNGVDRAVIVAAGTKPVIELEGARAQLGIFDALPERDQRALLGAVVTEAAAPDKDLAKSWRTGDMTAVERETRTGMLADPDLRAALFTGRNQRWTIRIAQSITAGQRPFVAVGAAHMAGPQGLPAMLKSRGFTVTRIE